MAGGGPKGNWESRRRVEGEKKRKIGRMDLGGACPTPPQKERNIEKNEDEKGKQAKSAKEMVLSV